MAQNTTPTIAPPSNGVLTRLEELKAAMDNFTGEYHKQFPGNPPDWETLTINVYKTNEGKHYHITVGDPCILICTASACYWVC